MARVVSYPTTIALLCPRASIQGSAKLRLIDQTVSVRGEARTVRAVEVCGVPIVFSGRFPRIARLMDESWQRACDRPDPMVVIEALRTLRGRPDLYTFSQGVTDGEPRYAFSFEMDNAAVATFDSYADWFEKKTDRSVRKHLRKAAREGVVVREVVFDDVFVRGIQSIYDETPVRQGRRFWHYGKSFDEVRRENATYLDRSVYIGAYLQGELIGFLKFVIDGNVASIMQILSKIKFANLRPTNALLGKAVESCVTRGVRHLVYGEHTYGTKTESTLIDFKEKNGFCKVEYPRYYVPLTLSGRLAIGMGVHAGWVQLVPAPLWQALVSWRTKYLEHRLRRVVISDCAQEEVAPARIYRDKAKDASVV